MTDDERAILIATAVAGELSADESARLDDLRRTDPTIDAEIAELRAIIGSVRSSASDLRAWDESAPSADLAARIASIPDTARTDPPETAESAGARPAPAPVRSLESGRRGRGRRAALLGLGAAACIAVGAIAAVTVDGVRSTPVAGPPGTLGAVEDITFAGAPSGVTIDAALVAHTWGTETVLSIDGLADPAAYSVVLIGEDGEALPSGTFLGSSVTITCRMNAALLREDVDAVEIVEADGSILATAELPPVGAASGT